MIRSRGWSGVGWGGSEREREIASAAVTNEKPRYLGGVRGTQRNAAGLLATVVSYKAFAEFFVFAVTLAALIANAFTTFRVLALAGFAVVSFDALAIFFPIAVTLVTLMANVLAAFGVLAFAAEIPGFAALSLHAFPVFFAVAVALTALTAHVLAVLRTLTFLDFRDDAISGRGNRWCLKSGRWRRSQCECRQGEGETKAY